MRPPGSVTVTRVRRCAEEAKGGLELAWSFGVASAFQRLCTTHMLQWCLQTRLVLHLQMESEKE